MAVSITSCAVCLKLRGQFDNTHSFVEIVELWSSLQLLALVFQRDTQLAPEAVDIIDVPLDGRGIGRVLGKGSSGYVYKVLVFYRDWLQKVEVKQNKIYLVPFYVFLYEKYSKC